MERFLDPHADRIYSAVRIVVGFLFWCHGAQKVLGLFGGGPPQMSALLWVAGLVEFVGGALVCVGLFTSLAAFVSSGHMAVAYFMAHQASGLLPIANRGELATLYAWVFLLIAAKGGGLWSLDARRANAA